MKRPSNLQTEKKIQETINKSIHIFYNAEKQITVSYKSFLYSQFVNMKKRWWIIQFILLLCLFAILSLTNDSSEYQHSMSIISTLFAVFIIPEFWKDKYCHATELEQSLYYSLRDIYCARLLLFGLFDIGILTIFNIGLILFTTLDTASIILNCYVPMIITTSICFFTLCKPKIKTEKMTIIIAIALCFVWWIITMNNSLYSFLQNKLWITLFIIGIIILFLSVYNLVKDANKI